MNVLTFRLRGYTGHPLPSNLSEELTLEIDVGQRIDVERLVREVGEDVGGGPRRISYSVTETSWGASASGAELIVAVPAIVTGAASLPVLWDTLTKRILPHGKPRFVSAEARAAHARTWLAESLNIDVDSVEIVELEPVGGGSRVGLTTPHGAFHVELDNRGVCRMRRQQSP